MPVSSKFWVEAWIERLARKMKEPSPRCPIERVVLRSVISTRDVFAEGEAVRAKQ